MGGWIAVILMGVLASWMFFAANYRPRSHRAVLDSAETRPLGAGTASHDENLAAPRAA